MELREKELEVRRTEAENERKNKAHGEYARAAKRLNNDIDIATIAALGLRELQLLCQFELMGAVD